MSIKVLHLRKNLVSDITLPENSFYIGNDFLNLPKSLFYQDLSSTNYKQWLWKEIKTQTYIYQQLLVITNLIILGNDITLACSCQQTINCNGEILKKAIIYLLEQEKLSANHIEPTSWEEYTNLFSLAQDKLHDFAIWLNCNNFYQQKLNFYQLWISFICCRDIA